VSIPPQAMNYESGPQKSDPIFQRLEDQISWYGARARICKGQYTRLKSLEIVFAAAIPVLSAINISLGSPNPAGHKISWIILCLGALITIIEGLVKLNSYEENWLSYRTVCENLKHEKFTYLAKAGPYKKAPEPYVLLAERIEDILSEKAASRPATKQQ
jgi:Protein of unknown function (DUF4231)